MKIGILTHYTVNNQGAQLQLYALYNYLSEKKYEVFVEEYKKNYDFDDPNYEKRNEITIRSVGYILKDFLIKKGLRLTWHNYRKYKSNSAFRETNFKFCHYSRDYVDIAIIGSDEVFSLQYGVNSMMYGHGVNAAHLIAYAPSIGQTDLSRINEKHCKELIASGLGKFDALSARDEHTLEIMRVLTDRTDIHIVCDPVLLYDFSSLHVDYKKIKEKYMIAYSYDRYFIEENEINAIRSYAKSKGLKVASIGTYHNWCDYNVICNPLQWIEYFRDAEEVVTNTFHGTILSIITNTPMAVISEQPKIVSLLCDFGLSHRNMRNIDHISEIMSIPMDFEGLANNLLRLRSLSKKYLDQSVEAAVGKLSE